jgi:hypothetical protein
MMPERDVPYHRQILRHLSRYRNRNVHAGHETAAVLTLLYQLKFYVERLLEFHLSADPSFGSVGEAARFLDPPRNRDALRERTRPTKRRQGSGRRTACEEARGGRRDRWGRGPLVRIEPEEGLCREARPRLVGSHSRGYGLPAIALVWNGEEHAIEEASLSALTSPARPPHVEAGTQAHGGEAYETGNHISRASFAAEYETTLHPQRAVSVSRLPSFRLPRRPPPPGPGRGGRRPAPDSRPRRSRRPSLLDEPASSSACSAEHSAANPSWQAIAGSASRCSSPRSRWRGPSPACATAPRLEKPCI